MSARLKLCSLVGFGAALVQWLASCTLTSDGYDPIDATAPLQPVAPDRALLDAGAPPASAPTPTPSKPPSDPCLNGSEAAGCEIVLTPPECTADSDCASRDCRDGSCQPASCDDGRLNQDEAATDCGGSACPACEVGASCGGNGDCRSGVCGSDGCGPGVARCCQVASCEDGVVNGDEPVADCGDARCGPCENGSPCSEDSQCESERCQGGICRARLCEDGVRGGAETDVDCGGNGSGCPRCTAGDICAGNGDCVSGRCDNGRCSSCGDRVRNGTETGVDCGGACGACAPGAGCNVDADCQSAVCEDGRCCGGTRVDCTRCARRLARVLNCGSNGPNGQAQCDAFLDCLADNANACPVRYEPGCTDDPGGVCNHTAFGGNTGPGVSLADAILGTAACTFGDE